MPIIRIATRNSPLALWQANHVQELLLEAHPDLEVEIVGMTTQGDQLLDRNLSQAGGKGLFLKELETSILENETDIAVHSMKDVPVEIPDGLTIAALCKREDARDVLVSNKYQNLYALHKGARVGTSSMRRISQLKSAFPALEFLELRGNVNTRLKKLDDGEYDAVVLAAAGLIRLGMQHRISQFITPELCLPAVGQGIIGIQCRSDDTATRELLEPLHNLESALDLAAERAMNEALGGGCHVPVAGYAEITKGKIRMRGMVGEPDGSRCLFSNRIATSMSEKAAIGIGQQVAEDLLEQGAAEILDSIYAASMQSQQPDKPLIILTRQKQYLGNMESILESFDFKTVHLPTFNIVPTEDPQGIARLHNLQNYTDLIFVSRNAVENGMRFILEKGEIPKNMRVMAVGAETAKQLYKEYNVDALFPDQGVGAEALLKVRLLKDLSGRRVLIVRGTNGLDWPALEMRSRGATVAEAACYHQEPISDLQSRAKHIFEGKTQVVSVFLHSAASAINLMQVVKPYMANLSEPILIAGSQRIARTALQAGWEAQLRVAKSPSNKHMLKALLG